MLYAALIGTGIIARDVYAGLFKSQRDACELKAVWSRSQTAADTFVQQSAPSAAAYAGDLGLQQLLADPHLDVVIIALPVHASLQVAEQALAAGKHVIQEKPIATTVIAAKAVIHAHRAQPGAPLWLLAENYRYENVFLQACQLVGKIGDIIKYDLVADMPMDERNKYFGSEWRRDTSLCPGGFLMDSAVHFVAALRLVAAAAGSGEATSACAFGRQVSPGLSFPDSINGIVQFASGVPASVSISLAPHQVRFSLMVVGTKGAIEMQRGGWSGSRGEYTLQYQLEGESQATTVACPFTGMADELKNFFWLISLHKSGDTASLAAEPAANRGRPEEGALDLALVEALVASAVAAGQPVAVVQNVA